MCSTTPASGATKTTGRRPEVEATRLSPISWWISSSWVSPPHSHPARHARTQRVHQIDHLGARDVLVGGTERVRGIQRVALVDLGLDECAQFRLILVGEVLGDEITREAVDEGCRELELLRRDLDRLIQSRKGRFTDLVGP